MTDNVAKALEQLGIDKPVASNTDTPPAQEKRVPRLVISHAEKGGVGKTLALRALNCYLRSNSIAFSAYDADLATPAYRRLTGNAASMVDLTDLTSVARVLDTLMPLPGAPTGAPALALVDLGSGAGNDLFAWLDRSGALDDAAKGHLAITLLFSLADTPESINHLQACIARFERAVSYVTIRNMAISTTFASYTDSPVRSALRDAGGMEITIPALERSVFTKIDHSAIPFSDFAMNADNRWGRTEAAYARSWLRTVFSEFARIHRHLV